MGELSDAQARLIDEATAAPAGPASLSDIKHVIILMQENRSFDHYFGTMSGVRGFSDPNMLTQFVDGRSYPVFDQFGYRPGKGADPVNPGTGAKGAPTPDYTEFETFRLVRPRSF